MVNCGFQSNGYNYLKRSYETTTPIFNSQILSPLVDGHSETYQHSVPHEQTLRAYKELLRQRQILATPTIEQYVQSCTPSITEPPHYGRPIHDQQQNGGNIHEGGYIGGTLDGATTAASYLTQGSATSASGILNSFDTYSSGDYHPSYPRVFPRDSLVQHKVGIHGY